MNRNQKIALGCGGAGCLGLIVLVIGLIVLSAAGYLALPGTSSNYNYNSNRNSNYNSNYNRNYNSNTNSSDGGDSSSLSDDEKHKLFQAAASTNDAGITRRVWTKLGFLNANGRPNEEYQAFVKEHISWLFRNAEFMQSINTPEKARAYVDEHLND